MQIAHKIGDFNDTESSIRDRNFAIIIAAATSEFAGHGLKGARMQAIADRACLPKGNVHYYFKTKESLYVSVLDNIVDRWNDQFDDINEDDDPAEALDQFIRNKVRFSFEDPVASRLFASEIIQGAPHLSRYLRSQMRPWLKDRATVIQSWITQGKMQSVDPNYLIFLIWSSTQHYADFEAQISLLLTKPKFDETMLQSVSDFLSRLILTGCGLIPPRLPNSKA
ncbi:MAG: TetR/AcrR family transcriptional regulator [Candidatus Azotimanducaceae bacterium]|jgi:TetR/AcrR family transcriptional regulator